jgi:Raf-like protein
MMKKQILLATTLLALTGTASAAGSFTLQADDLQNGSFTRKQLLSAEYGFGCTGNNQSPALSWKNAPVGTRSFLLTMHDPDAPTGGIGWTHWVVANIPAKVDRLPAGISVGDTKLPAGALQTRTDAGKPGYMGACPPTGRAHRYVITLTALKVAELPGVTADSTPALVGFVAQAHALGASSITVMYGR